jgi:carbon-monoxide dehydrogenase large subunit
MEDEEIKKWRLKERDYKLITGHGIYVNDIKLPGMLYCNVISSPYAHARIKKIDYSKALSLKGVAAIITGEDLKKIMNPLLTQADYKPFGWHWRTVVAYPLAVDKVRYMGEPVVAIAAENEYLAFDAAELIEIEYEPLKPIVDPIEALNDKSNLLYEEWGDNIQVHLNFKFGNVEEVFKKADKILEIKWQEARQSGFPLEPRGCVAYYNPYEDTLTVWSSTQSTSILQMIISKALNLPTSRVKVYAPNVGGGFGNKFHWWFDLIACALSIKTCRPIKFIETRRQNFLSQPHQRDVIWGAEAAVRKDGKILGIKAKLIVDLGVEGTNRGSGAPSLIPACLSIPNAYKLEALEVEAFGVVTNKSFYCAYRGYGKDKGIKLMERIIQRISLELGIPPEEVRFRNFIQPNEFPYKQISGYIYDSGNYPEVLKRVLKLANIEEWRKRQEELRKEGKYIGIGIAFCVEPAGVANPYSIYSGYESARVAINTDGEVEVYTSIIDIGQGISASIAKIVSETLGVPINYVKVISGLSDYKGTGTYSSRGAVYGISAVVKAAKIMKDRLKRIMGDIWKIKPEMIEIENGELYPKSLPSKRINLRELAYMLYHFPAQHRLLSENLIKEGVVPLDVVVSWFSPLTAMHPTVPYTTMSYSADVAIVNVDIETGEVKLLKYYTVHDAGRIISEEIVNGQIIGGIAQGLGAALYEELVYDKNGSLLTTSYFDYIMPSAVEMVNVEIEHFMTPSPFTEIGSKGMAEEPIYSSAAAIANAVEDALSPFGIIIDKIPIKSEDLFKKLKIQ